MKRWVTVLVLVSRAFFQAQDQSSCPEARHDAPTSTCGDTATKPDITVHVATIDTGSGGTSRGYSSGSGIGPEVLHDAATSVQQHQYRACDFALEIVERVKEPFQRLGYFCTDVEPIDTQQTGKNEYLIAIHLHPGPQYRVRDVNFSGATLLTPEELRSTFHLKPNSIFDTGAVRKGLQALQKAYLKKGNAEMVAVPVAMIDDTSKTISLEIKIQESSHPSSP